MKKHHESTLKNVEVNREMLEHLTHMCVLWNEEIMDGWFTDPNETMALQMMVEAHAQALAVIASRHPDKPALVETFIEELRDSVLCNPSQQST